MVEMGTWCWYRMFIVLNDAANIGKSTLTVLGTSAPGCVSAGKARRTTTIRMSTGTCTILGTIGRYGPMGYLKGYLGR
jgi:hypothetical protein